MGARHIRYPETIDGPSMNTWIHKMDAMIEVQLDTYPLV